MRNHKIYKWMIIAMALSGSSCDQATKRFEQEDYPGYSPTVKVSQPSEAPAPEKRETHSNSISSKSSAAIENLKALTRKLTSESPENVLKKVKASMTAKVSTSVLVQKSEEPNGASSPASDHTVDAPLSHRAEKHSSSIQSKEESHVAYTKGEHLKVQQTKVSRSEAFEKSFHKEHAKANTQKMIHETFTQIDSHKETHSGLSRIQHLKLKHKSHVIAHLDRPVKSLGHSGSRAKSQVRSPAQKARNIKAKQKLVLESFVVNDSGLSLSVISTMVYGTCKRWPQIAKMNHIEAPYRIRMGQRLVLEAPVVISKHEMDGRLLNLWRGQIAKRSDHYVHAYAKRSIEPGRFVAAKPKHTVSQPMEHESISVQSRVPAQVKAPQKSVLPSSKPDPLNAKGYDRHNSHDLH